MKVAIYPSERAAGAALAEQIGAALRENPRLVLGLPTGRTPLYLYRQLAVLHARGQADFSEATTFNLDEFLGVPADHPGSYRAFMERHLFSRINISRNGTHVLDGAAPDPEAECARYERAIEEAGGIDLQIVGIGTNGHLGFNEPGKTLVAWTHRVALRAETRRANAALFGGNPEDVPAEALSMGMATILRARAIILLATGRRKASRVKEALYGPLTTRVPASFLQVHREVQVVLDEAAAALLGDPDAPYGHVRGELD